MSQDIYIDRVVSIQNCLSIVRIGRWEDYNMGEEEAERRKGILDFLKKVKNSTSVIKHRAFVSEQVAHAEEWARRERRRNFQSDF